MEWGQGKANIYGVMEIDMKVIGKITYRMGKEYYIWITEMSLLVIGSAVSRKAKEYIVSQMGISKKSMFGFIIN